VTAEARPAPYPADTLAKGWRFELDMEQFKRSDTWKRARNGALRGALLLLWAEAWGEQPCGSLPNDDELISLLIDMPAATFAKNREVLLRGWWLADDGRLYHDTVTDRVMTMLAKRASDAKRTADKRARDAAAAAAKAGLTDVSRVTPPGATGEFDTRTSNTRTSTENPPKPPRKRRGAAAQDLIPVEQLVADGVQQQHATDWLAIRKEKNLPLTLTAWEETKAEAVKAGMSIDEAIRYSTVRSRGGFRAAWIAQDSAAPNGARPAAGAPASTDWWDSTEGIKAKGVELGLPAWDYDRAQLGQCEQWPSYRNRVFAAAGPGPWHPRSTGDARQLGELVGEAS
jgi:hypothetical protein